MVDGLATVSPSAGGRRQSFSGPRCALGGVVEVDSEGLVASVGVSPPGYVPPDPFLSLCLLTLPVMTNNRSNRVVLILGLTLMSGTAGVLLLYVGVPMLNSGVSEYISSFARGAPPTNALDPSTFENYWQWAFLFGAAWMLRECLTAPRRARRRSAR